MSDPAEYAATFRVARILVERRPTEVRANSASNLTPRCKRAPQSWWMLRRERRSGVEGGDEGGERERDEGPRLALSHRLAALLAARSSQPRHIDGKQPTEVD